jgi:hypothetical protein
MKQCADCVYSRARKPSDSKLELKALPYGLWCVLNGIATEPGLLRCGGDDFELAPEGKAGEQSTTVN